jgi:hypothetical protein
MPSFVTPSRIAALTLAFVSATALPGPALAQTSGEKAAAAQALFDEAMRLMKAGQAAEACPKLEEAQRLDAGMATQFRLAECYERVGKLASAWASFVAVADSAAVAKLPEREAAARKRAEALVPRLSRLVLAVPPAVAAIEGVELVRDGGSVGKALWGVPVPVDPGEHLVTVKAPGKKAWEGRIAVGEAAGTLTFTVQAPADLTLGAPPPPPPPLPPPRRSAVPAIVLGAVAAAGLATGAGLFALHASRRSDAENLSATIKMQGGTCAGASMLDSRCGTLASTASSSDTFGNLSTVGFAAGGAAAAAMIVYLLLPPPAPAPAAGGIRFGPALGEGSRGVWLGGSF